MGITLHCSALCILFMNNIGLFLHYIEARLLRHDRNDGVSNTNPVNVCRILLSAKRGSLTVISANITKTLSNTGWNAPSHTACSINGG